MRKLQWNLKKAKKLMEHIFNKIVKLQVDIDA